MSGFIPFGSLASQPSTAITCKSADHLMFFFFLGAGGACTAGGDWGLVSIEAAETILVVVVFFFCFFLAGPKKDLMSPGVPTRAMPKIRATSINTEKCEKNRLDWSSMVIYIMCVNLVESSCS